MSTRSILVRPPPYPFTLEALRPNSMLASLASILENAGHTTGVLDCATVECFERLYPDAVRAELSTVSRENEGSRRWFGQRVPKPLRQQYRKVSAEIAEGVAGIYALDFVGIQIESFEDLKTVASFSTVLRKQRPELVFVALGAYFVNDPSAASQALKFVDAVYTGGPSPAFAYLADSIRDRPRWASVPGLTFREGQQLHVSQPSSTREAGTLPSPAYDPEVYPAMREATKIMVFDVDGSYPVRAISPNAELPPGTEPLYTSSELVLDEVVRLHRMFRTRAFHIRGVDESPESADALSFGLMSRGIAAQYSRDSNVASATFSTLAAMKTSGCCAVSFDIHSGSQRLLDDYYGTYMSVSTAEDVIHTARRAGMFTVARFTFPCVADDYHTKAETLRLISRMKPGSAPILFPQTNQNTVPTRRMRRDREELCEAIRELGIPTDQTPELGLLAALAGQADQETAFRDRVEYQLTTGDCDGLVKLVERINRMARVQIPSVEFKPFVRFQQAMGN
ncbi:MAG: hypothetical protein IIB38_02105 [Candidatus Hydrogenedentes bacterium]|nr:hypothetical protein [Candidatus Hydrogenedentota bacterium]